MHNIGIGFQINKPITTKEDRFLYAECAAWCNQNQAMLKDSGSFYEVVSIPEPSLEDLKALKLQQLEEAFMKWYEEDAIAVSSLGFTVDSDARAMLDASGLVTTLSEQPERGSTISFMDHDNQVHELTLDQMKTLQLEIIQNGQYAYEQKWNLRNSIESVQTKEELNTINIKFSPKDFSK